MLYCIRPNVLLVKGMRMIILLSEAYHNAHRHFRLSKGVNTYSVWEQRTSGLVSKALLRPYTGEGPPIKVVATLKDTWQDKGDYLSASEAKPSLMFVDGFDKMSFEQHQAYPLHMHKHCQDQQFLCKQCDQEFCVGSVDGRFLFSVGWICGPCRDYLQENCTISPEDLDEHIA